MELHPDLAEYLQDHYRLGLLLKHPLVFSIPYSPEENEFLNAAYLGKKKEIESCLAAKKFSKVIWLYERPFRMEKLLEFSAEIESDKKFWSLLGSVYTDTENLHETQSVFQMMLECGRPGRENMMTDEERTALEGFPEELVVFRGHQGINKYGFSWTLSHLQAMWFSKRFQTTNSQIAWGRVKKEDVIGFFHRRREMDILVNPNNVRAMAPFKLPVAERPDALEEILSITSSVFALDRVRTAHGPDHWMKVEYNGMAICDETPLADRWVVRAFAFIHDCKRENEHKDPEHGHRAANFMLGNKKIMSLLNLTAVATEKLVYALKFHNDGQVSDDPTIGACWDADRLDLTRVGYIPDPKMFSTIRGRELIFNI